MNRNNFFVKFAYFYTGNVKNMLDYFNGIWDTIADDLLPALMVIFANILFVIASLIMMVLPISTIRQILISQYLTSDEIKRMKNDDEVEYQGGYFRKKEIKEYENKLLSEQKEMERKQ